MKVLCILALACLATTPASAQSLLGGGSKGGGSLLGQQGSSYGGTDHQTSSYYNNRGTFVEPHYQTNPNNTQYANFSSRGNYNPHTGSYGTRQPKY